MDLCRISGVTRIEFSSLFFMVECKFRDSEGEKNDNQRHISKLLEMERSCRKKYEEKYVLNTDLQLQLRIKFVKLQKDFDTVLFYVCMYTDFSFVHTNFLFTENSLGKTRAINLQIAEIRVYVIVRLKDQLDIILFRDFEILFRDYFLFPRIIQCIILNRDKTILIL